MWKYNFYSYDHMRAFESDILKRGGLKHVKIMVKSWHLLHPGTNRINRPMKVINYLVVFKLLWIQLEVEGRLVFYFFFGSTRCGLM